MAQNGKLRNKITAPTLRMVADLRNGDAIHRSKYPKYQASQINYPTISKVFDHLKGLFLLPHVYFHYGIRNIFTTRWAVLPSHLSGILPFLILPASIAFAEFTISPTLSDIN